MTQIRPQTAPLGSAELAALRDRVLPLAAELGAWAQQRSDDHYRGLGGVEVGFKTSPGDVVTSADIHVQQQLSEALAELAPGFGFLGEEEGRAEYDPELPLWVVDPIDGTHNFVRNYPGFCVSVALAHRGELQLAVVYDAATRTLFSAYRGGGAWRHSLDASAEVATERLHVSGRTELASAMVTTGFTAVAANDAGALATFAALAGGSAGLRVSGSAARDACFVASGKVDLYWQYGIKPWDVAPVIALVTEAGGVAELRHEGIDWLAADSIDIFAGSRELVATALALASQPPAPRQAG